MGGPRESSGRLAERRLSGGLRITRWLLAAVVFSAPLALGALHTGVLIAVTVVVGLAMALSWLDADVVRPRAAANALVITATGLIAYTVLQGIPLPTGLLRSIAPANADVWSRTLLPLREAGPALASLSLDPVATHLEVLRGVAYLLAFLAALRVGGRRDGVDFLAGAMILAAVVLGAAAMLHPAFGAEKVFGLYRPTTPIAPRHIAPILNPNALAAFLNIGFCLALAWAVAREPPVPRPLPIGAILVLAAIQLWVASRGGVIAMGIGGMAVLWMARSAKAPTSGSWAIGLLALASAGAFMLVLGSSDDAWQELTVSDLSKLQLNVAVMHMIAAFPWFGAGRGAFESVFPSFREGTGHIVFTHPENVASQWASEWGIPVALVAGGVIVWALRPRVALARGPSAIGPWAALLAVGVHNFVDFSTEIPAVMLSLAICAGLVVGGSAASDSPWGRWSRRPRLVATFGLAAAAAAVTLGLREDGRDLDADRLFLHDAALGSDASRAVFDGFEREAMLRHPAEPYIPFAAALRASRTRDASVVPWVAKTLERAPVYGPAHFLLARALFRDFPAQARLEYRYAVAQAPELAEQVGKEGQPLVESYDDALEMLPPEKSGVALLKVIARGIGPRLPATQEQLDDELLRRQPNEWDALARQAERALSSLEDGDGSPWCAAARVPCANDALVAAVRVVDARPRECLGFWLRARVEAEAGQVDAALDHLATAAEQVEDRSRCLMHLVELASDRGRDARASTVIDELARAACATEDECAVNLLFAASAEVKQKNPQRALALYRKSYEAAPKHEEALITGATLASQIGLHGEAFEMYQRLSHLHPDDGRWPAFAASERQALLQVGHRP